MILRDFIRQPVPADAATAAVATPATPGAVPAKSVAIVARVAVAKPPGCILPDIPPDWRAGLALFRHEPGPVGMGEARWRELVADALRLAADWGEQAHALGWSALDLFGCSPGFALRLDRDGVAMFLRGRVVARLDASGATIANPSGAPNVYRRRAMPGSIPIWRAMEAHNG